MELEHPTGPTHDYLEQSAGLRIAPVRAAPSRAGGMPRAQKRRAEECSGEHGCVNEEAPAALRRRTEAHQNVAEKVAEAAQEVQMAIECPVCLTRPASTAFACGHCFCSQDGCPSSTVESCPTCRESVQQRIKLFGFGSIESLLDLLNECDVSDLSAAEGTRLQPSNGSLAAVLPGSDTTTLPGPPEGGMARRRFVSVGSKVVAHFAGRKGYAGWYDATISSVRGDSDTCVVQWHDGETRDTIKRSCELCIPLTTLERASGSAASDREQLGELFEQQEQHERALKRFAVDSEALEQERKRVAKELKKEKHRLLLAQEELDVQKQEREELETRFRRLERDLTKKLEVANNEINCLRRTETLAGAAKLEVDARLEASAAETEQVKADRDRLKRCLLEMDDDLTKEQALRKTYSQVMAAVLEVVPGFSFDAAESEEGCAVGKGNGDSKVERFICELVDSARKAEDSVGDDVFRVVRAKINSARKPAVSGAQAEKDESAAAISVQHPQGSESATQCPACAKVFVNQLAVVRHLVDKNDEQHRNYRATFTRGACLIGEKPHVADENSAEADATDRYEYSRSEWKRKKRLSMLELSNPFYLQATRSNSMPGVSDAMRNDAGIGAPLCEGGADDLHHNANYDQAYDQAFHALQMFGHGTRQVRFLISFLEWFCVRIHVHSGLGRATSVRASPQHFGVCVCEFHVSPAWT